jgi:hypothetical protein
MLLVLRIEIIKLAFYRKQKFLCSVSRLFTAYHRFKFEAKAN